MLDAGEDPKFIARRMIVLASEDIGNADPMALTLATSAVHRRGLRRHARSAHRPRAGGDVSGRGAEEQRRRTWRSEAASDVRERPASPVPLHLRNAPTALMKGLGYGAGYKYGHDHPDSFTEQQYLPDDLKDRTYYRPTDNGAERTIRERLNSWWKSRRR